MPAGRLQSFSRTPRSPTDETLDTAASNVSARDDGDTQGQAPPFAGRPPSLKLRRVQRTCSSSPLSKGVGRYDRRPQGPARAVMASLRDRWWCEDMIDASAILCWTACRPPSVSGCRAFRPVRTRWKPVSSSQGAPFRRTACRWPMRRLPGRWPGPDAMGSVSSAYALRTAGGRRWRPWCRTSE